MSRCSKTPLPPAGGEGKGEGGDRPRSAGESARDNVSPLTPTLSPRAAGGEGVSLLEPRVEAAMAGFSS